MTTLAITSTADLTPIPIARPNLPESPTATTLPTEEHPASLRGRVGQGVDAIAGSANKVILGVVDSSFGVLRAFLPGQSQTTAYGPGHGAAPGSALFAVPGSASGTAGVGTTSGMGTATGTGTGTGTSTGGETDALWGVRPSLGLLRRETGFSIAGLTAALPGGPGKPKSQSSHPEEEGQRELVEVSSSARPPSFRNGHEESGSEETEGSSEEDSEESEGDVEGREDGEVEGKEGDGEQEQEDDEEEAHDTRSIKSFESMLSSGRTKRKKTSAGAAPAPGSSRGRKRLTDLTDRLTHGMAGMSRRVQGGDARGASTLIGRLPPPNRRFVECTEQDIRVSEVGELLREYQRLVEAVRSAGGFQE